jgi:hypothetical protein
VALPHERSQPVGAQLSDLVRRKVAASKGCGKTKTLRTSAGLEQQTARLRVDVFCFADGAAER